MARRNLTRRERDVVALVVERMTNPQIAAELGVSVATVKRHLSHVMIKWNAADPHEVAARAIREREGTDEAQAG